MNYTPIKEDSKAEAKLLELSEQHPTRGFERYYGRIRNEGLVWKRKRVVRIYRKLNLKIRRKKKRRLAGRPKQSIAQPISPLYSWSMDFMQDSLDNGPEFISYAFVNCCKGHNITIDYIQPGKAVQNAYIERLNQL